jgi:uncharacterized glyoxalase superfamily protein PhnB
MISVTAGKFRSEQIRQDRSKRSDPQDFCSSLPTPGAVVEQALAGSARQVHAVSDVHGWQLGRVADPFGHHWEIERPLR